jgi:ABC-type proline/glycine betaine transport system substrate-binding protein
MPQMAMECQTFLGVAVVQQEPSATNQAREEVNQAGDNTVIRHDGQQINSNSEDDQATDCDTHRCMAPGSNEENPAAARLFEVMSMPLEDIAQHHNRMNAGENTEKDVERHMTEWKAPHQNTWNGRLEEARKAAM